MANLGASQPLILLELSPHDKSPSRYLSLSYWFCLGFSGEPRLLQGLLPRIILEEWNFKDEDFFFFLVLWFLELAL